MKIKREALVGAYITDALLLLMRKKDYKDISITEICEKAGVTRMSFYRNFESKEDILKKWIAFVTDTFLTVAKYDMEVYDKTPYVGGERGDDITAWFKRNPGDWQYAILDDDDDMGVHIDHLVRTDFDLGLTEKEADRCIELLQEEG